MIVTTALFTLLSAFEIAGQCRFPDAWQGWWFQSTLGDIYISHDTIEKKGVCTGKHRNYYLLENRENQCFQCLLMEERHPNILQYQQGYCQESGSLSDICALIREDAIMWTFIREPSTPTPCPFQDAYHFQYNNQSGGYCTQPMSYVEPCAGDSKLQMEFKHCDNAAYTHNQVLQLQCLAVWSDNHMGSLSTYMYGRLEADYPIEKNFAYRCFMVQTLGTVVYLAMSADSTCRGIRSPRDGPLTVELTKDIFGWPEALCTIPRWMSRTSWQDLSGRHTFSLAHDNHVIHRSFRRHTGAPQQSHTVSGGHVRSTGHGQVQGHVRTTYRCIEMSPYNNSQTTFSAVMYTSHHCKTRYQCMKVIQIHHNVLQVVTGHYTDFEEKACLDTSLQNPKTSIIIPLPIRPRECPLSGHYFVAWEDSGCSVELRSGCTRPDVIDIVSSCSTQPVGQLECVESWRVQDQHYLIARNPADTSGMLNCFKFRYSGSTIDFETDSGCNLGVDDLFTEPIYYRLDAQPGSCDDIVQLQLTTHPTSGWGSFTTRPETEVKLRRHQSLYKVLQVNDSELTYRDQQYTDHVFNPADYPSANPVMLILCTFIAHFLHLCCDNHLYRIITR